MIMCVGGLAVLFIIGGDAPLLRQAGLLPIFLQIAALALVITWVLG